MPKYWVKNYFTHGRFPEVGQKQKTEKKKKKKEKRGAKVSDNNGQATHGARKHAWRMQAAWAKNIDDGLLRFHIPLVWIACEAGDEEMLMTLVKLGADINVPAFTDDGLPLSCLWIAAKYGHFSVVTYLLEHGAQVC